MVRPSLRLIQLLALSASLTLPLIAQNSTPQSQSRPADTSDLTLRTYTRLVYVDVVARDSKGNVMRGLTQQGFKVLEDGRPVPIDFFTAHIPAPTSPTKTAEPAPEISKNEFANFTAGDTSKPLTIVLYDLLNTPNDDQLTARQQMLKFLDMLPSGERITVFALTNGLEMTQVLTGDPVSRKAVSTMLRPRDVGLDASKNETMNDLQVAAASRVPAMAESVNIAESQNYDVRARTTISMLAEVARAMEGYPGRKSLYWLAESFPLSIDLSGGWRTLSFLKS
jgi:VWFA-related protein